MPPAASSSPVGEIDPMTARRWIWAQHWSDVLFLHWRTSADVVRRHLPAELDVDRYDGNAWVSLVLFRLKVRPRWLPFVPGVSRLLEANLRTYVRRADKTGIYFLHMLASNRLAIWLARLFTPLPYRRAALSYGAVHGDYGFQAASLPTPSERLELAFRPATVEWQAEPGSLDAWLVERYRLFVKGSEPDLRVAHVVHPPWPLRDVDVRVHANTIGRLHGFDMAAVPDRAHYSVGVPVRFGGFQAEAALWPAGIPYHARLRNRAPRVSASVRLA